MSALARSHDWAATSLGASADWSPQLRVLTEHVLSSPLPMVLFWGPDWIQIYNDAVADLLDSEATFGAPTPLDWHRQWDLAESPFNPLRLGQSCIFESRFRWFRRSGVAKSSWFTLTWTPVQGDGADIAGALLVVTDTTRQAMAEITAENTADRLRALLRVTPDGIFRLSADGLDLIDLDGREFTKSIAGPATNGLAQILPATDATAVSAIVQKGVAARRPFEFEHRVIKRDRTVGWSCTRAVPLLDVTRRITEWYGAMTDISSRKETEERLRQNERQFRRFGQASRDLLWIRDGASLEFQYLSPALSDLCGESLDVAAAHARWSELIHPSDAAAFHANLDRVRKGECLHHEYRILRRDRATRWLQSCDFPILDEAGRLHQIAGIARDVTEHRGPQDPLDPQDPQESSHRTRNLLTMARGLVTRTLDSCESIEEFEEVVDERLRALAVAGELLSRGQPTNSLSFRELVRSVLEIVGAADDARITLQGSARESIPSAHIPTLALALHELIRHAIKQGALAEPGGRVQIRWNSRMGYEPRLLVDWQETCDVSAPVIGPHPGIWRARGRELIETALQYQMRADTTFQSTDSGFLWTSSIPLAVPETD